MATLILNLEISVPDDYLAKAKEFQKVSTKEEVLAIMERDFTEEITQNWTSPEDRVLLQALTVDILDS